MIFRFPVWNRCGINQGKKHKRKAGLLGWGEMRLHLNIMNLRFLCHFCSKWNYLERSGKFETWEEKISCGYSFVPQGETHECYGQQDQSSLYLSAKETMMKKLL